MMEAFIPLARPDIRDEDIQCAVDVLKTGMLVQGPKVLELESRVSQYLGASFVAGVSNGTATMHLALKALGIGPGDEVIVPAFSYVATANVVELVGAKPVFVDIDLATFNLDTSLLEQSITDKTRAIIPVHEFGLMCNMQVILELAHSKKIPVIEDAACALGASADDKLAGTLGDFGSFSLHPRKAISSGEGGLLCSKTAEMDEKIRILRNHGMQINHGKMDFVEAGFNYRMTDFQAALVSNQLLRLEEILQTKQKLAEAYLTTLQNSRIRLPEVPQNYRHSWQTFHVMLDDKLNRDEVILQLKEKQIGSNYGAQCIPAQSFYQNKYGHNCLDQFPNALKAYEQGLAIPLYERLKLEDIYYISDQLNRI